MLKELLHTDGRDLRQVVREIEALILGRDQGVDARLKIRGLIHQRWIELGEGPPAMNDEDVKKWKRARGYELERLLFALFALEGLNPSPPYRGKGEQIDGMFELEGRFFLVETKWETHETPASEIFAFRGKIEGKLAGTLGVFVSAGAGFSGDAPTAITWGKDLNVILIDHDDIDFATSNDGGFREIMRVKLRRASQHGQVYYAYKSHVDERAA